MVEPDPPRRAAESARAGRGRVANQDGLEALGRALAASDEPAQRRLRRRRRLRRTLVALCAVVVLLVGSAAGYAWYLNHEIHRIHVRDLTTAASSGRDEGTENILMVGSTDRCALKVQNPAYGLCSEGVTGINSDVVMILHLNPAKHSVTLLSIPRDLFVPNARQDGPNKIDAALYEGPSQLVDAIQEDFGIPIQHYVELNFDSFINVVNALGGITMYFPEPVFDAYSGLNVQTTGCKALNGTMALQLVRARHLQYKGPGVTSSDPADWPQEAQSDLARITRDHEFLRVLATAMAKRGLGNPITDQQIISSVAPQLEVDSGLSASDMVHLVLTFHSVNVNQAPQLTLPVLVDQGGSYQYNDNTYGDVEFPDTALDYQAIDRFLDITPTTNSMTGQPLPNPSTVSVSVMNGTGATNQASDTAAGLQALGFHITTAGDVTPLGTPSETYVYYSSTAPAEVAAAQAVVHSLSGSAVLALDPSQVTPGAQVTVVTGTNLSVNPPPPAPTHAHGHGTTQTSPTAPAPTTTTTTAPSSGAAVFSPPSSANPGLAPWDPRACTASGGEGS